MKGRIIRISVLKSGFRNSASPTSANLTLQETTQPEGREVGSGEANLYCPGSSVVADGTEGES